MDKDRRILLSTTIFRNVMRLCILFIHLSYKTQEDIGTFRNIEIGPTDALNLDNLAWGSFRVFIMRDLERPFDM